MTHANASLLFIILMAAIFVGIGYLIGYYQGRSELSSDHQKLIEDLQNKVDALGKDKEVLRVRAQALLNEIRRKPEQHKYKGRTR